MKILYSSGFPAVIPKSNQRIIL